MGKRMHDSLLPRLAVMLAAVCLLLLAVFTANNGSRQSSMSSPHSLQTSRKAELVYDLLQTVDGKKMMANIQAQLSLGPRFLGSPGHTAMQGLLVDQIDARSHKSIRQSWAYHSPDGTDYQLMNIIGRLYPEKKRRIILGTHYDSKMLADEDPTDPTQPVPGANDSASGVAVLFEVAQLLATAKVAPGVGVDIVFFDGEEGDVHTGGDYSNWEPLGSTYFARHLADTYPETTPESGVVIDMVCDRDLHIDKEYSSYADAKTEVEVFWHQARQVNAQVFTNKLGLHIRDDHTPLNAAGIPSFLLIDYNYPPFHTTKDTADKCSPVSLEAVAQALIKYIYAIK